MAIIKLAKDFSEQIDHHKVISHRSGEELQIRKRLEDMGRIKYPNARQIHELVVGQGTCRADMAFVEENHLISFEIKSQWDNSERLFKQAAMFSLASPETWIVADAKFNDDVALILHLMPHIGYIKTIRTYENEKHDIVLEVVKDAEYRKPHIPTLLGLLWVAELLQELQLHRLWQNQKPPTHKRCCELLASKLSEEEIMQAVCRQLRGRDAFWKSDPLIQTKGIR